MLLMDKSTISMVIFNSFLYVYKRVSTGGTTRLAWTRRNGNSAQLPPGGGMATWVKLGKA